MERANYIPGARQAMPTSDIPGRMPLRDAEMPSDLSLGLGMENYRELLSALQQQLDGLEETAMRVSGPRPAVPGIRGDDKSVLPGNLQDRFNHHNEDFRLLLTRLDDLTSQLAKAIG